MSGHLWNATLVPEGSYGVQDAELSSTPKGTAVCKFTVACHRMYKQDDEMRKEVSFFDVTTWMRQAEVCGESLQQGRGERGVGRLKQDWWTDPAGKPHARVLIVAKHVEFKPQIKKDGELAGGGEEKAAEGVEEAKEAPGGGVAGRTVSMRPARYSAATALLLRRLRGLGHLRAPRPAVPARRLLP